MPWLAIHKGEKKGAFQVPDDADLECPECGEEMTSRAKGSEHYTAHFAHSKNLGGGDSNVGTEACETVAESDKHIKWKNLAAEMLSHTFEDNLSECRVEKTLEAPASGKESRIGDAVAIFAEPDEKLGDGIVVEVQHRNHQKDIEDTTEDYIEQDLAVVWAYEDDFGPKDFLLDELDLRQRAFESAWPNQVPEPGGWGSDRWINFNHPMGEGFRVKSFAVRSYDFPYLVRRSPLLNRQSSIWQINHRKKVNSVWDLKEEDCIQEPAIEASYPAHWFEDELKTHLAMNVSRSQHKQWSDLFPDVADQYASLAEMALKEPIETLKLEFRGMYPEMDSDSVFEILAGTNIPQEVVYCGNCTHSRNDKHRSGENKLVCWTNRPDPEGRRPRKVSERDLFARACSHFSLRKPSSLVDMIKADSDKRRRKEALRYAYYKTWRNQDWNEYGFRPRREEAILRYCESEVAAEPDHDCSTGGDVDLPNRDDNMSLAELEEEPVSDTHQTWGWHGERHNTLSNSGKRSERFKRLSPSGYGSEWRVSTVTERCTNRADTLECYITGDDVAANEPHLYVTVKRKTLSLYNRWEYDHFVVKNRATLKSVHPSNDSGQKQTP